MRKSSLLGVALLVIVAIGVAVSQVVDFGSLERQVPVKLSKVDVHLVYGGEKAAFLANPAVVQIINERYNVVLHATKRGSIKMVKEEAHGADCLWPSNAIAVEIAMASGKTVRSNDTIFNSPIVFYAKASVTQALLKAGIVEKRDNSYYVVKTRELIKMILAGKKWHEDLGVRAWGTIKIFSTDPVESNSGNMWAALLSSLLSTGEMVTADNVESVIPLVKAYFTSVGYMEQRSDSIFEAFLKQSGRPMIVGYENQLVEFVLANPNDADAINNEINVLYPEPTMYASHPLIALTSTCERLETALKDPDVQVIAWKQHGFRTGLAGVQNNPRDLAVQGIPPSVDMVIPMPTAMVVERIIDSLNGVSEVQ